MHSDITPHPKRNIINRSHWRPLLVIRRNPPAHHLQPHRTNSSMHACCSSNSSSIVMYRVRSRIPVEFLLLLRLLYMLHAARSGAHSWSTFAGNNVDFMCTHGTYFHSARPHNKSRKIAQIERAHCALRSLGLCSNGCHRRRRCRRSSYGPAFSIYVDAHSAHIKHIHTHTNILHHPMISYVGQMWSVCQFAQ